VHVVVRHGILCRVRMVSPRRLGVAVCFVLAACGGPAFQAGSGDGGDGGGNGGGDTGAGDSTILVTDSSTPIDGQADSADAAEEQDAVSPGEGGGGDAAPEVGVVDSGTPETGVVDSGAPETGPVDSGMVETGPPTCVTGEVCVAAAPPGWTGPVQFVYSGSSPSPACPVFTSTGFSGGTALTVPPATCSACACSGAPSCANATTNVSFYANDNTCTSTPCLDAPGVGSACTTVSYSCGSSAITANVESTPSSASCTASTQSPTLPATSWTDHAQACNPAPTADSCGAGKVCTSAPPGAFRECVYQSGDIACPSTGPYTVKQLVDTTVADGRSCTACSCGLASGASCSTSLHYSLTADNCTLAGGTITAPEVCHAFTSLATTTVAIEQTSVGTPTPTTCAAGGGQPTGTATPATPITVCCGP